MISKKTFIAEELPYKQLEGVGIARKQILDMPKAILKNLLSGQLSPLLELNVHSDNGKNLCTLAKLRLTRDKDGKAQLMIYPSYKNVQNDLGLHDKELDRLKDGQIIKKELRKNGQRKILYVQLDHETNCLLKANCEMIKIPNSIGNIELGQNQKKQIREGKPVQIDIGDKKNVTIGISLKDPVGFKIIDGDLREFEKQKAIKWDIENPDKIGFWHTSENGWEYQKSIEKYQFPKMDAAKERKSKLKI